MIGQDYWKCAYDGVWVHIQVEWKTEWRRGWDAHWGAALIPNAYSLLLKIYSDKVEEILKQSKLYLLLTLYFGAPFLLWACFRASLISHSSDNFATVKYLKYAPLGRKTKTYEC